MRKYFLISAVALLATNTMAQTVTNTATVKAQATIQRVSNVTCSDLNFGTILIKNGGPAIITIEGNNGTFTATGNSVISITDASPAICKDENENIVDLRAQNWTTDSSITLKSETNPENTLTADVGPSTNGYVYANLSITSDAQGTYEGSLTLTKIE